VQGEEQEEEVTIAAGTSDLIKGGKQAPCIHSGFITKYATQKGETLMETETGKAMMIRVVSEKPYKEAKVTIEPDSTASEILEKAGFDPNLFMLAKKGNESVYELGDQPYADMHDGEKLNVVQHSNVT